nr:hypothetical protein Iba_chr10cCG0250 [Ipomoea batatas]
MRLCFQGNLMPESALKLFLCTSTVNRFARQNAMMVEYAALKYHVPYNSVRKMTRTSRSPGANICQVSDRSGRDFRPLSALHSVVISDQADTLGFRIKRSCSAMS